MREAHSQGRVPYPADGRADLLLPPHQHERARRAALVDRSPAVAPRRAYRRPVRLPGRSPIVKANALQGPIHPMLGIAMDMSIQLKAENGAICTLSLSFNNEGPLGTFFRYIGDSGTYIARYDDLFDGKDEKIDVIQGRRLDERHRVAGSRVLRRHPRRPRAQRRRRWRCCRATACSTNSSGGWGSRGWRSDIDIRRQRR